MLVIATGVARMPASLIHSARHLAVAVEGVRAGEDGLIPREPLAGTDDRNAGPHRSLSDDERALAAHDGRVPHPHALDVGDGILGPRREIPYPYSQLAGAHAASAAQGEDAVHLLVGELEIEDVEVLPEVLLAGRLGDGTTLSCCRSQRRAACVAVLSCASPISLRVLSRPTPPRERGV